MNESFAIFWKKTLVGHISGLSDNDWHLSGRWTREDTASAHRFETLARGLDLRQVREFPLDGILIQVRDADSSSVSSRLVFGLQEETLLFRTITPELTAALELDQFPPWKKIANYAFFEDELKREVSAAHPLNGKMALAFAKRTDCDDVLFELPEEANMYAVVHLTYKEEQSKHFPSTRFYKDWDTFYKEELAAFVGNFDVQLITSRIVEEMKTRRAEYDVHVFDTGAASIDIYWKEQRYVVQLDNEVLGLSEAERDADLLEISLDERFTDVKSLMEAVKIILQ